LQSVISRFPNLYPPELEKANEGDDDEGDKSIQEHYGWFYTLYELGKSPILSAGGENNVLSLNVIYVLNYLSMLKDIELEKAKQMREQQRMNKIK